MNGLEHKSIYRGVNFIINKRQSMENYTAHYSGTGTAIVDGKGGEGQSFSGYKQYSFFAQDNTAARSIAEDFAWRFNNSRWSGPTIGLETIVEKDGGEIVFESP